MSIQALLLFFFTFLSKIAGFLRDLVLSYYYGASSIVDAYIISTTIPMVIFSFVGTGIQTSLIPMLNKVKNENKKTNEFISNVINVFILFCIAAIVLVLLFTRQIVTLFASGFDEKTMCLAVSFTRFSIIGIIFSTLTYIFTSIINYNNKFVAVAISTLIMDGVVLIFVILSHYYGLIFLPIGNVVALLVQSIFLRLFIKYKHKFFINVNDENFKILLKTIVPIIIGTSVNQLNLLIDQTLASRIVSGGISYLNYANKVLAVVQGVLILSFISYVYPKMSAILVKDKIKELESNINKWSVILGFLVIPCAVVFCMFSNKIINILFYRGNFTIDDVNSTGVMLFIYAIQLPFYAIRELMARVYYANRNSKLPLYNSILGLVINVLVALIFIKKMGLLSLPFSTIVSCIFTSIFMVWHYIKDFVQKNKSKFIFCILVKYLLFLSSFTLLIKLSEFILNKYVSEYKYGFILPIGISFLVYISGFGFFVLKNTKNKSFLKI